MSLAPRRCAVPAAILIIALGAGVTCHIGFLAHPRTLWNGIAHDRNGHYDFALDLALAIRQGDVLRFFKTVEKASVWPPIHGLATAVMMAVGGLDYRVAVQSSVAGWLMTAWFAYLLARRICVRGGDAAGAIAAVMILASPGYRAYAEDIMLESLGAGLTMLVLYAYAAARQDQSNKAWRRLGFALTALFLEKYNYWLIAVLALAVAEFSGDPRGYFAIALRGLRSLDWTDWVRRQLREPLSVMVVAVIVATLAIEVGEPPPLEVWQHRITLYPPRNLATAAFVLLLVRVAVAWRRNRMSAARLTPATRAIALWHALPVMVWMMVPEKAYAVIFFLSPWNAGSRRAGPAQALSYYTTAIVSDYHASWGFAVAAILCLLAALIVCRRWGPEGRAPLAMAALGFALVILHPQHESRFLHSWLAAAWVAGAAALITIIYTPAFSNRGLSTPLAAAAAIAAAILLAPNLLEQRAAGSGQLSLLDISDAYLPELAGTRRVAIFSTIYAKEFAHWTYVERYRRRDGIEWPVDDFADSAQVAGQLQSWCASSPAETVVLLEIPRSSPDYPDPLVNPEKPQLSAALDSFAGLRAYRRWYLPAHDVTIRMWLRDPREGCQRRR